jgi:hypothetical protein
MRKHFIGIGLSVVTSLFLGVSVEKAQSQRAGVVGSEYHHALGENVLFRRLGNTIVAEYSMNAEAREYSQQYCYMLAALRKAQSPMLTQAANGQEIANSRVVFNELIFSGQNSFRHKCIVEFEVKQTKR